MVGIVLNQPMLLRPKTDMIWPSCDGRRVALCLLHSHHVIAAAVRVQYRPSFFTDTKSSIKYTLPERNNTYREDFSLLRRFHDRHENTQQTTHRTNDKDACFRAKFEHEPNRDGRPF